MTRPHAISAADRARPVETGAARSKASSARTGSPLNHELITEMKRSVSIALCFRWRETNLPAAAG